MKVLAPIDGSDCSYRALRFAAAFVTRYEGTLHVVHITVPESRSAEKILAEAARILDEEGVRAEPETVTDLESTSPRYGTQVGKDILTLVEDREYDHVVMGHHGTGYVGQLLLGSAAQRVVRAAVVPVSVIP